MDERRSPGPGRSTSESALDEVKKAVAARNAAAQRAARELNGPYARIKAENRRRDLAR